jgi:hypothetical protein
MFKNLTGLIVLTFLFLSSCNFNAKEEAANANDTTLLTVLTFDTSAHSYVDKPVWIEGTVSHTCKHGGKRMFLADGNDSVLVEVTTGPDIVKFEDALIGSRVKVLGNLRELRIDDKYLNEWEAELKQPAQNTETGVHTGQKGHEDQTAADKFAQINSYRQQLKESGTDHLSFYSIEAMSFSEVK